MLDAIQFRILPVVSKNLSINGYITAPLPEVLYGYTT